MKWHVIMLRGKENKYTWEESHVSAVHYSSYLHNICVAKHARSSNLRENKSTLIKVCHREQMLLKEDKQNASWWLHQDERLCYFKLFIIYRLNNPPFLHHITAPVIITHKWDMGMFVLNTRQTTDHHWCICFACEILSSLSVGNLWAQTPGKDKSLSMNAWLTPSFMGRKHQSTMENEILPD